MNLRPSPLCLTLALACPVFSFQVFCLHSGENIEVNGRPPFGAMLCLCVLAANGEIQEM